MTTVQGTIKHGQIILDAPAAFPEGTRVEILPIENGRPSLGMREEDWPTTPEGVAALVARMDQLEAGWLSPEDDRAWRTALHDQKDAEKARFYSDAEAVRGMWE